jgi:hypothetical protein
MVDAAEKHDCLEAVVARQKEDARKKKACGRGNGKFQSAIFPTWIDVALGSATQPANTEVELVVFKTLQKNCGARFFTGSDRRAKPNENSKQKSYFTVSGD